MPSRVINIILGLSFNKEYVYRKLKIQSIFWSVGITAQRFRVQSSEVRSKGEYRMSNVEGMYSVYFIKKIEQIETTLRYSAVHHSAVLRFAVQPLNGEP